MMNKKQGEIHLTASEVYYLWQLNEKPKVCREKLKLYSNLNAALHYASKADVKCPHLKRLLQNSIEF